MSFFLVGFVVKTIVYFPLSWLKTQIKKLALQYVSVEKFERFVDYSSGPFGIEDPPTRCSLF